MPPRLPAPNHCPNRLPLAQRGQPRRLRLLHLHELLGPGPLHPALRPGAPPLLLPLLLPRALPAPLLALPPPAPPPALPRLPVAELQAVRPGCLLPLAARQGGTRWHDLFFDKLSDHVKLVGPTIRCPRGCGAGLGCRRPQVLPHVVHWPCTGILACAACRLQGRVFPCRPAPRPPRPQLRGVALAGQRGGGVAREPARAVVCAGDRQGGWVGRIGGWLVQLLGREGGPGRSAGAQQGPCSAAAAGMQTRLRRPSPARLLPWARWVWTCGCATATCSSAGAACGT